MRYTNYLNSLTGDERYSNTNEGRVYMQWLKRRAEAEKQSHLLKMNQEYQSTYDEAKSANLDRYNKILQGYETRYDDAMNMLDGMGDVALQDVERAYNLSGSKQAQGLVNSGLYSTTIAPAAQRQNTAAMMREKGRVQEALRAQKLGYMNQLSGDRLSFMERREDPYPDFNQMIQLARGLGYA